MVGVDYAILKLNVLTLKCYVIAMVERLLSSVNALCIDAVGQSECSPVLAF